MEFPDDDSIASAKAGTDQMGAIYRDVWIPFFADLDLEMERKNFRPSLRDMIISGLHESFLSFGKST